MGLLLSAVQPKRNSKQVETGKAPRLCFGSYRFESRIEHNFSFLTFIFFFWSYHGLGLCRLLSTPSVIRTPRVLLAHSPELSQRLVIQ